MTTAPKRARRDFLQASADSSGVFAVVQTTAPSKAYFETTWSSTEASVMMETAFLVSDTFNFGYLTHKNSTTRYLTVDAPTVTKISRVQVYMMHFAGAEVLSVIVAVKYVHNGEWRIRQCYDGC